MDITHPTHVVTVETEGVPTLGRIEHLWYGCINCGAKVDVQLVTQRGFRSAPDPLPKLTDPCPAAEAAQLQDDKQQLRRIAAALESIDDHLRRIVDIVLDRHEKPQW